MKSMNVVIALVGIAVVGYLVVKTPGAIAGGIAEGTKEALEDTGKGVTDVVSGTITSVVDATGAVVKGVGATVEGVIGVILPKPEPEGGEYWVNLGGAQEGTNVVITSTRPLYDSGSGMTEEEENLAMRIRAAVSARGCVTPNEKMWIDEHCPGLLTGLVNQAVCVR